MVNVKKIIKRREIPLKTNHRIAITAILCILIIFSIGSAYAAFQQPTTIEKNVVACEYTHRGDFKYVVYLKNNTVYETNILFPGQGTIFKKITDHIDGSLSYTFKSDRGANISGNYRVYGVLQTNLWKKKLIILNETSFSSDGNVTYLNKYIRFPINYTYFENITNQITEETGVKTGDLTLLIKCEIRVIATTDKGTIHDFFTPTLNASLGKDIITFEENLEHFKNGFLRETIAEFQPGVIQQQQTYAVTSVIFPIILIVFLVFTTSQPITTTKTEKMIKKTLKKYGEWIVEVEKIPRAKESIPMKSLDDLIKISEELGKPVIHHTSSTVPEKHRFYVLDESLQYEYIPPADEKIKKIARCPQCGNEIICEGYPGKEAAVVCPKCGNEGIVSFEKPSKWKKYILKR
jgi:rubrerythrin